MIGCPTKQQAYPPVAIAIESCPIMATKTLSFLLLAAVGQLASAQSKATLTPADYGKWETLGQATLSADGKWLAHDIRRTDGNNELRVASTAGTAGGKTHVIAFCSGAAFSADS